MQTADQYNTNAGQLGALGKEATAKNNTFQQIANQVPMDFKTLADELDKLRRRMREADPKQERDVEIAAVEEAKRAALLGDHQGVFSNLKRAGKWTLDFARDIGVELATEAIKKALGM